MSQQSEVATDQFAEGLCKSLIKNHFFGIPIATSLALVAMLSQYSPQSADAVAALKC